MRHRWKALIVAVGLFTGGAVIASAVTPSPQAGPTALDPVLFPDGFCNPILVGTAAVYPGCATTTTTGATTSPSTTTIAPTTSSAPPTSQATTTAASTTTTAPASTSTSTTNAPTTTAATTTTAAPATSTTSPGPTACGSSGAAFCEDFSSPDPNAWKSRFDHGWSGELHAGSAFGADKNGWPGDHDMMCGNPNMTHRTVTVGPGADGQHSPQDAEPAFYACLPGGNPASGHLMTSVNTEGYVIAWFSPKQFFTNVRKVCFDNNLTYLGNGIWFQMVFLTPAEVAKRPDGVLDLGFISPDFAVSGPSTVQGLAGSGIKFSVDGESTADSLFRIRPWAGGQFTSGTASGPGTADKAPRYQICTTDNGNGTLTITNGSPDGTVHTNTMAGSIPDGPIRIVFEHDEYNPDKHHSNAGPVGDNQGEGYTYHWDNVQVYG